MIDATFLRTDGPDCTRDAFRAEPRSEKQEGNSRKKAQKTQKKIRRTAINDINELCDFVRETAFAIHRYHRHGHLEKVYENALAHRLRKAGIDVQQQHPLSVLDEDGTSAPKGSRFANMQ